MTPLERLLAEEIPTGTFGHARPPAPADPRPIRPWTPEEQAAHREILAAALDGWQSDDPHEERNRASSRARYRHLRVIDGDDSETAA